MKRAVPLALLLGLTGCAELRSMLPEKPPPIRFRVGDYVVYRFSGNYTEHPVVLRKEVLDRKGDRVTFDVTATRGTDSRHWTEAEDMGVRDPKKRTDAEVHEYIGGVPQKVSNENNDALSRLYSWISLTAGAEDMDPEKSEGTQDVAGTSFNCTIREGLIIWHRDTLKFRLFECPEFVWFDGGSQYWNNRFGDNILKSEVVEFGNVHSKPATAASP